MDRIFYNGKIYSMDNAGSTYEAVGIDRGKIAFLGTNLEAVEINCSDKTDLEGRTVLPGFIDSHIHCVTYAWYENCVKLHGAKSLKDVLELTESYMSGRDFSGGKWIIGRGWNHFNFDVAEVFTRQDLDSVCSDVPVAYLRSCGHMCVVNTKAMEIILKLDAAKPFLHEIDREKGIMHENAARLFLKAIPAFDKEELAKLISFAGEKLNECGITGIHSDDVRSLPVKSKYETLEAFKLLKDSGNLNVRIYCLNTYDSREQIDEYIADGYKTGQGDDMFRIGPVKIITDGALGGKTAALTDPYAGTEDQFGILHYSAERLEEIVSRCRENGLDITIHAIGDRAMENAVQAVKASNEKFGDSTRRHGVLHSQVAMEETLREMGRQNMQAFIQPVFVGSDMDVAEKLVSNHENKKLYAWKSMLDAGMNVAGSACSPVEKFNVLENIQYAVTREKLDGGPEGGWLPQERLTVKEAVELFTVNGAYASYEESIKGTLEEGKLADMVVLSGDIFETELHKIKDLLVLQTVLGGKTVYERKIL